MQLLKPINKKFTLKVLIAVNKNFTTEMATLHCKIFISLLNLYETLLKTAYVYKLQNFPEKVTQKRNLGFFENLQQKIKFSINNTIFIENDEKTLKNVLESWQNF